MVKALGHARAVAYQGFISWRALASLPHAPPQDPPQPTPMKMLYWLKKTKNDAEASSSRSTRRGRRSSSPPPPVARTPPTLLCQLPPPTGLPRLRRCHYPHGHGGRVAEHLAYLPPLPPLPLHARPVVDYEGQEVPPPPGIPCHRRRPDHPHGVVINQPSQPQPEVIVDLVSDDEK
jgi:hypothetical protein